MRFIREINIKLRLLRKDYGKIQAWINCWFCLRRYCHRALRAVLCRGAAVQSIKSRLGNSHCFWSNVWRGALLPFIKDIILIILKTTNSSIFIYLIKSHLYFSAKSFLKHELNANFQVAHRIHNNQLTCLNGIFSQRRFECSNLHPTQQLNLLRRIDCEENNAHQLISANSDWRIWKNRVGGRRREIKNYLWLWQRNL